MQEASLRPVLKSVIRRAFPELKHKHFTLSVGCCDSWMYYESIGPGCVRICVDESLLGAPHRVLAGCFAHELSHILRDSRMRPAQRLVAFVRYNSSALYRTRDERQTDLEVIRRGYGGPLLAFMLYAQARGYEWQRNEGLTIPEVRSLL